MFKDNLHQILLKINNINTNKEQIMVDCINNKLNNSYNYYLNNINKSIYQIKRRSNKKIRNVIHKKEKKNG